MTLKDPIFLVAFVFILLVSHIDMTSTCAEEDQATSCPDEWTEVPEPASCIKLFTEDKKSYYDAAKFCTTLGTGSTLFVSHNAAQGQFVSNFLKTRPHSPWIGLSDLDNEGTWKWSNQMPMTNPLWKRGEPSGKAGEDCVFINKAGRRWADDSCRSKKPWICQQEHPLGPRELKITVSWHRNRGYMYRGYNATVKCSAFSPVGDVIHWTVSKGGASLAVLGADTRDGVMKWRLNNGNSKIIVDTQKRSELARSSQSVCGKKLTLEFRFLAKQNELDQLEVSCFSRPKNSMKELCPKNAGPLSYCRHSSPPMLFLDGPKGKPSLKTKSIDITTVSIECTVEPGEAGDLTWVTHFKFGPKVLDKNDKKIKEFFKGCRTDGKEKWSDNNEIDCSDGTIIVKSVLLIKLNSDLNDGHVACFSHDVGTYRLGLNCEQSNPFCARSKNFSVAWWVDNEKILNWLMFLIVLLLWLLVSYLLIRRLCTLIRDREARDECIDSFRCCNEEEPERRKRKRSRWSAWSMGNQSDGSSSTGSWKSPRASMNVHGPRKKKNDGDGSESTISPWSDTSYQEVERVPVDGRLGLFKEIPP